jgi:glutaredoxin 2
VSNFTFTVNQSQSANVLAQAQVAVNIVIQALQSLIAQGNAMGGQVTLTTQSIQQIIASLNLAAQLTAQASVQQQQAANVNVGGAVASTTQQQIINAISQVQAQINATINAFQSLLSSATAMGGSVTVSVQTLQQILVTLNAVVTAIAQIIATQQQTVMGTGAI